ncbi:MAG: HlyD family type I secretion periplasmic adaptor subunit [Gammaproteobacteria bacterium]|nr:HlyD family type I secretion periplasmic adaptor subunit [Gammaproteobacteria bacterium]
MQDEPPSPLPRVVLATLVIFLVVILLWAYIGQLDVVVRAEGKLLPVTRLKVVQPLEGGRVDKILVSEGDRVQKGQTLLVMDTIFSEADTEKLREQLGESSMQQRRIEAELSNAPFTELKGDDLLLFKKVRQQFRANTEALRTSIDEQESIVLQSKRDMSSAEEILQKLKETLPIYQESENALNKLGKNGYVNKLAILEKQKERINVERDLSAQEYLIESLSEKIRAAQSRVDRLKASYRQDLFEERAELNKVHAQLEQEWIKQEHRNQLMELRAPQEGYVQELAIHTEGTVVPSGTVLLTIIPADEPLKAEVYLNNRDIASVKKGQEVKVKLAAYEFQRYGQLDAKVDLISADTVSQQDKNTQQSISYRAQLELANQFLERGGIIFSLRPGMMVTAEIKVNTRSVMEYLLSPIQRAVSEAGTER